MSINGAEEEDMAKQDFSAVKSIDNELFCGITIHEKVNTLVHTVRTYQIHAQYFRKVS